MYGQVCMHSCVFVAINNICRAEQLANCIRILLFICIYLYHDLFLKGIITVSMGVFHDVLMKLLS